MQKQGIIMAGYHCTLKHDPTPKIQIDHQEFLLGNTDDHDIELTYLKTYCPEYHLCTLVSIWMSQNIGLYTEYTILKNGELIITEKLHFVDQGHFLIDNNHLRNKIYTSDIFQLELSA